MDVDEARHHGKVSKVDLFVSGTGWGGGCGRDFHNFFAGDNDGLGGGFLAGVMETSEAA